VEKLVLLKTGEPHLKNLLKNSCWPLRCLCPWILVRYSSNSGEFFFACFRIL